MPLPLSELTSRLLAALPPPLSSVTLPSPVSVSALVSSIPHAGPYLVAWPVASAFGTVLATLMFCAAYTYWSWFVHYPSLLPWQNLPGPPSASLVWGNQLEFMSAAPSSVFHAWIRTYGPTLRYTVMWGHARILTADAGFVAALLTDCETFHKPWEAQMFLRRILGNGLTAIEGREHVRIRRVCAPAFSHRNVRRMAPVFFDKAEALRDAWAVYAAPPAASAPAPADEAAGGRKIDVMKGLMAMAVDVIGEAGFGYDVGALGALHGGPNALVDAFRTMVQGGLSSSRLQVVKEVVPWLRWWRSPAERTMNESVALADAVLSERLRRSKAELAAQMAAERAAGAGAGDRNPAAAEALERGTEGKDLLSLLLRSNMSPGIRAEQRLSDYDIQSQLRTFMLAGNETTSSTSAWALLRLARAPGVQARARAECLSLGERPGIDALDALPFLDAVVRECLRIDAAVQASIRTAQRDVTVPLATPVRGRDGRMVTEVRMRRGDTAFIPMQVMNWDPDVWGTDALEFNPDRFARKDVPAASLPGIYGNIMTFNTGRHSCIGWRLAVTEIKVALFVLLRAFSFEELPSRPEVVGQLKMVLRPAVKGEDEGDFYQLPLLVRALDTDEA